MPLMAVAGVDLGADTVAAGVDHGADTEAAGAGLVVDMEADGVDLGEAGVDMAALHHPEALAMLVLGADTLMEQTLVQARILTNLSRVTSPF